MKISESLSKIYQSVQKQEDTKLVGYEVSKSAMEYIFKITGYFLVTCLLSGIVLVSCSQSVGINMIPVILFISFFFYVSLTSLFYPIFNLIGKMKVSKKRRILGILMAVFCFFFGGFIAIKGGIIDLFVTYIFTMFPEVQTCENGIIEITKE